MARKAGRLSLIFLLALLVLGAVGGSARPLLTTTLLVQAIGDGKVSGGGGQINCGEGSKSCYASYVSGASVTITAGASAGWTFDSWDGCPSPSGSSCTVALGGGDYEVKATFTTGSSPGTSTLLVGAPVDSTGHGGEVKGGDVDCGSTGSDCEWDNIPTGSTVTVLETPDAGYIFTGWGGACSGTARSCTVAMDSDQTINASFAQSASSYLLSVTVTGNGTVTGGGIACTSAGSSACSASEASGSTLTLTATAGSGSGFTAWGGACAGSATTCTLTMNAPKSVTAAFSTGTSSSFPLAVSVTGPGTVAGGGIHCGSGSTTCSANEAAKTTVILTATPGSGATFAGWGGACTGSSTTCAVTMNGPKTVSATFSGGAGTQELTVTVTGHGTVTGGGIDCGNGAKVCSASVKAGATVTLTATAASGATFTGWGAACSGTSKTCTVTLNAPRSVSATFTGGAPGVKPGSVLLQSGGPPVVRQAESGFEVTLRFRAARGGIVRVRALRAGRIVTTFAFSVGAGPASIGPFRVVPPGFYTFEVTLAGRMIHWTACLGRCGAAAHAAPFFLVQGPATAVHAGAAWSVRIQFRASQPAGAELRIYRGRVLAWDDRFASRAGSVAAGPFVLTPGTYTFRLTATDAYGRVRTLTWIAVLP